MRQLPLDERPAAALAARFMVLQCCSLLAAAALPCCDLAPLPLPGDGDDPFAAPSRAARLPLGARLLASKGRLLPDTAAAPLAAALAASAAGAAPVPDCELDLGAASLAGGSGGAHSLLEQLFAQLAAPSEAAWRQHGLGGRLWHARLVGLNATDAGGVFRDTLAKLAAELCPPSDAIALGSARDGPPPLFVLSPNGSRAAAFYADCYLPRGGPLDAAAAARLAFVGRLLGGCLRSGNPCELTLPPLAWKALLRERLTVHDLATVDAAAARRLAALRACAHEEDWPRGLAWPAAAPTSGPRSGGGGGGGGDPVPFAARRAYTAAALREALAALAPGLDALRSGLEAVVPRAVLALLTWRELERRAAGTPAFDVAALRAVTRSRVQPEGAHYEAWLWDALAGASDADRRAFLAFATGRSRLPSALPPGGVALVIDGPLHEPLDCLPRAATCSFTFFVAPASSAEALRERLLYAIRNCCVIDADGTHADGLFAMSNDDDAAHAREGAAALDDDAADEEANAPLLMPLVDLEAPAAFEDDGCCDSSDDGDDAGSASSASDGALCSDSERSSEGTGADDGEPWLDDTPDTPALAEPPAAWRSPQVAPYATAMRALLHQVHPDMRISRTALVLLDSLLRDCFEVLVLEAGRHARAARRTLLRPADIAAAVRAVFPGELAKHGMSEATRAYEKYLSWRADEVNNEATPPAVR
jgi:histone H3/H4